MKTVKYGMRSRLLEKNTLGEKVKNLSTEAGLSRTYTNHCLRATSITVLDRSGLEARHIMSVSGHQSETSIRRYASHLDEKMKKDMAMTISASISGQTNPQAFTEEQGISMLGFLVDNIFVMFGGSILQQVIRIPMGINSAP